MDSAGIRPDGTAPLSGEPDIHRMDRKEAEGVARLMHEAYGATYPKKYVYDPDQLWEKNVKGEILSVVATGPGEQVIGYFVMNAYYGYPEICLLGSLVVSPRCRGQGIAGKIARYLVTCNESRDYVCFTAGAFTAHPYSQQVMQNLGYHTSAILIGSQPQEISFRGISEKLDQRESVAFITKVSAPPTYPPQYLPEHHAGMILEIGNALGIQVTTGTAGVPGSGPTRIEHRINRDTGSGLIWVRRTGPDSMGALAGAVGQLLAEDAKVLRLHLDLSDPGSPALVSAAEEMGFVFSGILAGKNGIILLLQHLQGISIDFTRVQMADSLGKRLLAYIHSFVPDEHTAERNNR